MPRPQALLITHGENPPQDFVSQHLRELGYATQWIRPRDGHPLPDFDASDPAAHYALVVVYGGPQLLSAAADYPYLEQETAWVRDWVEAGGRLLGICLGAQLLARAFGGEVRPHAQGQVEVGFYEVEPSGVCSHFMTVPKQVYQWHREGYSLPSGAERLATSAVFPEQAFCLGARALGLQFHPEVTQKMMRRWVRNAAESWDAEPGAQHRNTHLGRYPQYQPSVHRWVSQLLARMLEA